jgi:hypothetical protein
MKLKREKEDEIDKRESMKRDYEKRIKDLEE